MERNQSASVERDSSSWLEENLGARMGENLGPGWEFTRKRPSWVGIYVTRPLEEKTNLEASVEKSVENREKANLGTGKETGVESRMDTGVENREETDMGNG